MQKVKYDALSEKDQGSVKGWNRKESLNDLGNREITDLPIYTLLRAFSLQTYARVKSSFHNNCRNLLTKDTAMRFTSLPYLPPTSDLTWSRSLGQCPAIKQNWQGFLQYWMRFIHGELWSSKSGQWPQKQKVGLWKLSKGFQVQIEMVETTPTPMPRSKLKTFRIKLDPRRLYFKNTSNSTQIPSEISTSNSFLLSSRPPGATNH